MVEGLAFSIADGLQCMSTQPNEISAVGGAARSDLLLQSIADATGRSVRRIHGDQAGTRGAAILAARSARLLTPSEAESQAADVEFQRAFSPESPEILEVFDRYRIIRSIDHAGKAL